MKALFDKALGRFISKKLFVYLSIVGLLGWGVDLPAEFFYYAASYTLGQSGVDMYAKVKAA